MYEKFEKLESLCKGTSKQFNEKQLIPSLDIRNAKLDESQIIKMQKDAHSTFQEIKNFFLLSSVKAI
jgi:hypothetical protein